jgi:C-terminal processing protease CtpA/Prc
MLRLARDEVKKHYYDPNLQSVDWDVRYSQYSQRVGSAQNLGDAFRAVAAFLSGLQDSHTYFVPPQRSDQIEPGYRLAIVGDSCFVARVRPKTDAESKLHPGDQIVKLNGFNVNRSDFHDMSYAFRILAPPRAVQLDVQSPTGELRRVVVNSTIKEGQRVFDLTDEDKSDIWNLIRQGENEDHVTRAESREIGDLMILKFPQFDMEDHEIDRMMSMASKHKALILDLRGNPGGSVDCLEWLVGTFFDHDVKMADRVGRKSMKPMLAKHHAPEFDGKLIVLVDSGSASAAELLARVVQLEHRGTVIGDKTSGSVMEAHYYPESQGADTQILFGFSITDANLIMSDGKSLEKAGVVPDELLLPTAADLAAGRDPVLSRAAELAGVKLDSVAAGKMFPIEWLPL